MNKYLLLLFAFLGALLISNAQQCENLVLEDVDMTCADTEVTLSPSFLNASYKSTRAYTVNGELTCPIPVYDQEGFTGIPSDDDWSEGIIQLGFDFCFFENQYDRVVISDNGKITFDQTVAGTADNDWNLQAGNNLPTQEHQTNAIFAPFMDTDVGNSPIPLEAISFGILNQLSPGERVFGVEYNVGYFGGACNGNNLRSRALLYESSNVIDIVIMEKPICTGWNEGRALIGIQNKSGTIGYSPIGRENGQWVPDLIPGEEERGELWRFVPDGPDSSEYAFAWFKEDADGVYQYYSGDEDITITPQEQENYRVDITVTGGSCSSSDQSFILSADATITPGFTPDIETPVNLVECENPVGSLVFDFDLDQTNLVLNGLTATDFNVSYHDSFVNAQDGTLGIIDETVTYNSAGSETIFIRIEDAADTTCYTIRSYTLTVLPTDDSTISYANNAYCLSDINPLPDNIATTGGTFIVSNGGTIDAITGELDLESSGLGTDLTGMFTITYTTNGTCLSATDFIINLTTIVVDILPNTENCDSFELPVLNTNNTYHTATNGGGTMLNAGDLITSTQVIYIFAQNGGTPNCTNESSFEVTINETPTPDDLTNVTACDTYALATLINGNYFTESNGNGTQLNAGDNITSSQTVYIYAETATSPNCFAETSFDITINTVIADVLNDVSDCNSYELPTLNANNTYHTATNGGGTMLNAGDLITSDQTIYIFAQNGGTPNCTDESSFTFSLYDTPSVTAPTTILESCDNGNGSANFDILSIEDEILGATTGVTVTYHSSNTDANSGMNEMSTNPELVAFGNVWARVENINGCFSIVEIPLIIEQCFLMIPQGFSPESSITQNQTFTIEGIKTRYPNFKLYIYNRFGKEVFYGNASNNDWNGKYENDGEDLPTGTYFYGIELNDDQKTHHKGWVYLQR